MKEDNHTQMERPRPRSLWNELDEERERVSTRSQRKRKYQKIGDGAIDRKVGTNIAYSILTDDEATSSTLHSSEENNVKTIKDTNSFLTMVVPADFNLEATVTSYGFYVLSPNRWIEQTCEFSRPLRYGVKHEYSIMCHITQENYSEGVSHGYRLHVSLGCSLSEERYRQQIVQQVARMFRTELNVSDYHDKHPEAKAEGYGRLFRSPTLWEDLVKTQTCTNMSFSGSKRMNTALCREFGGGAFPTPWDFLEHGAEALKLRGGVGYRAARLVALAKLCAANDEAGRCGSDADKDGGLGLEAKLIHMNEDEAYSKVLSLPGFGPFGACNVAMLLGFYRRIPCDSETIRHVREVLGGKPKCKNIVEARKLVAELYSKFEPYQFCVYWFCLNMGYNAARLKRKQAASP